MALKSVSKADPNYVPNYQLSGIPYVISKTGVDNNAASLSFPFVTKSMKIQNFGSGDLRIGFTEDGVDGTNDKYYFFIPAAAAGKITTVDFDVRCKTLWYRADDTTNTDMSVYAALTPINSGSFPNLTSANGFAGIE